LVLLGLPVTVIPATDNGEGLESNADAARHAVGDYEREDTANESRTEDVDRVRGVVHADRIGARDRTL